MNVECLNTDSLLLNLTLPLTMAMPTMAALPRPDAIPPKYQLQQGKTKSTLQIGNWRIETAKLPILNGKEIDA